MDPTQIYHGYIDCLNRREWDRLGDFVGEGAIYNGQRIGLQGYRRMLEADCRAIPDLCFDIALLVVDAPWVAAHLRFDCTPAGQVFGLPVNGRRVRFDENVFYRIEAGRIVEVRSVIDKAAIAAQL